MKSLLKPLIFISAHQSGRSPEQNFLATNKYAAKLQDSGLLYVSAVGSYEGVQEQSFAIPVTELTDYAVLRWAIIGEELGQDSIMVRYPDGSCYLVFCAGSKQLAKDHTADVAAVNLHREYLGQWREVSKSRAEQSLAYSRINNRYFMAE